MEGVFTTILERGMAVSFLVLAVVLLRFGFKKMPKWFRCVLWGLVAFRLVCPFSFESSFSLMPDVSRVSEVLEENILQEEESAETPEEELLLAGQENSNIQDIPLAGNEGTGNVAENTTGAGNIMDNTAGNVNGNMADNVADTDRVQNSNTDTNEENLSSDTQPVSPAEQTVTEPASTEQKFTWQQIQQNPMPYVWLAGVLLMAFYGVVSYFKVKHQVKASWNVKENIFYCDDIDTPFVFGLVKPGIYMPSGIEEVTAEYVLRHEKEHLRRGDQWWKLFGFGLLAVYWFNPALWVAYILFCKDIEFACDERAIRGLEEQTRREYAQALLSCSIGRRIILFCPTAFGENSVKSRIRSVMMYKKATIPVLIVAVLLCVVVGAVFLTDRKDAYGIEREHLTLETDALDEKMAEDIAEDIAELMVESQEGIYQLENFNFTFYELESEQDDRLLRVSVEADSTCLRSPEDSPLIQGMKKAQSELTYEAEQSFAQRMIDSMLIQLKQEVETTICEPAIFVTLNEKNHYELYYGDANRTPLKDYYKKEDAEKEQMLGCLTVYQRAGIQPPMETVGSSGYVYSKALKNPETEIYNSFASYVFSPTLYYKEGVYSYLERYEAEDKSELPWELLGEELVEAYSNHELYWSERDALTECTGNGTLYAIKGYEDNYRVALCYEKTWPLSAYTTTNAEDPRHQSVIGTAESAEDIENTTYYMIILERMNDLWLHEGREVFQQRMHLENAVSVNGLFIEEELFWSFLAELFDVTFIHPASGSFPELVGSEHQNLVFQDALGFKYSIALYEGGYVQETVNGTKLVARIDEELCRRVMERIETWKIEQFEVSFEQAILVEAILNQEEDYGEVYEKILSGVDLLTSSEGWQFFGEEGCYISRVPIRYYHVSEEELNEAAMLILFSKDFSKAASMTLDCYEDGSYSVTVSDTWNSSIQKEMQAHPEEEFIFLYSLKSGLLSGVVTSGALMLDAQNEVRYAYPQGEYYIENNLYQKLYSDELAVSYEELTAVENLIWIPVTEGAVDTTPIPTPIDLSTRTYHTSYEASPYAAFSAEDWLKGGRLEVPFERGDVLNTDIMSERYAMWYIPEAAIAQASTKDLARVAAFDYTWGVFDIYDRPSFYLDIARDRFNAFDALFGREDMVEAVLAEYEAAGFYLANSEDAEYKKEASRQENGIVTLEIILATDEAFDKMNGKQGAVVQAVLQKMKLRESGMFYSEERTDGFFSYIKEHEFLGSKWYNYLTEQYAENKTVMYYLENACYPMDSHKVWSPRPEDLYVPTITPKPVVTEDAVIHTLNFNLLGKECRVDVIGKEDEETRNWGAKELRVYAGEELLQTILVQEAIDADGVDGIDKGYTECPYSNLTVALRDVNFDTYLDLEVWGWCPNNSIPYYYWCWNPETEQFEYAFTLQLTDVDEERKHLISHQKVGGGVYYTERYRVTRGNKLELAERMTEEYWVNTYASWKEAYLHVIENFPDNMVDPYGFHTDSDWTNPEQYIYLGIHDFTTDGTPELIIGDSASLAVFTYKNGRVEKCIDIVMQCCWQCIDDVAFHDNALLTCCSGSDGSGYTVAAYRNGAWTTAVYCEYHPKKCTINGEAATYEEFCEAVPFDPKDWEGTIRDYDMRERFMDVVVTETEGIYLMDTWTKERVPLDETFDFELIRWTKD